MAVADSEEPKSVSASVVRSNDSNLRKSLLLLRLPSFAQREINAVRLAVFSLHLRVQRIGDPTAMETEAKTVGEVEDHSEIETESGSRFLVDEQRRYPSPTKRSRNDIFRSC